MANLLAFSEFVPPLKPILEFDLKGGLYRVTIHMKRVVSGPPSGSPDSDYVCRAIEVEVELARPDKQGRDRVMVLIQLHPGRRYDWPLPGKSRPAIAEFQRVALDDSPAVRLVRLESDKLVSGGHE
ncbi:MAG: hypothetical protein ACREEW_09920 [Caulobacteraceae bacterium]